MEVLASSLVLPESAKVLAKSSVSIRPSVSATSRNAVSVVGRRPATAPRLRAEAKQQRRIAVSCSAAADGGAGAGAGAVAVEVPAEEGEATADVVPIEQRFPAFPSILDINAIRNILPHRFPFLLVDRVIEYNPGVSAVAIKNVTINDNFFPGHFPERPIMPGVLMVEALAQVGGIVMLQPDVGGSKENFFFAGVDKVRFRKPVIAGDTLVMRMTLIKFQRRFGIVKMEGKAYVGGQLVCEGEFLMAIGSSDA